MKHGDSDATIEPYMCACIYTPTGAHVLQSNYSARELKPLQCPFNSVNYHNHVFLSSLTYFSPYALSFILLLTLLPSLPLLVFFAAAR